MKIYKIEDVKPLFDKSPKEEFEAKLNDNANSGWELHSLIPQVGEDGTFCNVAIYVKEI